MRRFSLYIALAIIVFVPLALVAQKMTPVSKPTLKSVEVKHFTNAEGVQLSPNFSKVFYASFLAELQRLNISDQVVEDGTPVNDTQGSHGFKTQFIIVEGRFVAVKEGRQKGDKFEAGAANIEIHFYRRSDHKEFTDKVRCKIPLNGPLQNDEQIVAESAGVEAANAVRKFLYPSKASWLDLVGW